MAGPAARSPRAQWMSQTVGRRAGEMAALEARATDALGWLAVERQAANLLRHLATWIDLSGVQGARPDMEEHRRFLISSRRRAGQHLAGLDPLTVEEARRRLGIRLALIGKGGAGKTVIASTMARLLGRRGHQVLAVDLDSNPGLAISLGLGATESGLPAEAIVEHAGSAYGWALAPHLTSRDVVERYARPGPDNVCFLGLGKIGALDKTRVRQSVVAVLHAVLGFAEPDWHVIADLEAGPSSPYERFHAFSDDVLVVVGPAWRSAMTARRLLPMVGERTTTIVGNRFRDEPDHPGLVPVIRIPDDPDLAEAERQGLSPLDACPDSPAIAAIGRLADLCLARPREWPSG